MTNGLDFFNDHYQSLVLDVLCGRSFVWPSGLPVEFEDYFLSQTRHDGIQLLIHDRASQTPAWEQWPANIRKTLDHNSRNDAIIDILRQQNLGKFSAALQKNSIEPILLKGVALSLTHYPTPHIRTRSDTDVLIPAGTAANTRTGLESSGFKVAERIQGEYINHQQLFDFEEGGTHFFYDVHHKLMNPKDFAETLSYDEIAASAVSVSVLGVPMKSIGEMHALLHACMHRVAHHFNEERLIWLYDIHLLLKGKNKAWIHKFYELAREKQMVKICGECIRLCCRNFQSIPDSWLLPFENFLGFEESEKFLKQTQSQFSLFLNNFSSTRNWKKRRKLVQEHFFPSADYMKAKYSLRSNAGLPFFYVWRIISGLPGIFRKLGRAPAKNA